MTTDNLVTGNTNLFSGKEVVNVLVCGGGGGRGLWQWEIIKGLSDVKFDSITGTSAGALNAFLKAKGIDQDVVDDLYYQTFHTNASPVTKPYLARLDHGELKFEKSAFENGIFKKIGMLFSFLGKNIIDVIFSKVRTITNVLDNSPLFDTIERLDTLKEGVEIDCSWVALSLRTGKSITFNYNDFEDPKERAKSLVASTNIPFVWKVIDSVKTKTQEFFDIMDGGGRDGIPLKGVIDRFDTNKRYKVYVLSCNKLEMDEEKDFSTADKIAARVAEIAFNESLKNDLQSAVDKNQIAFDNPLVFLSNIEFVYIEYPGTSGTFEFTPEAYLEQKKVAVTQLIKLRHGL